MIVTRPNELDPQPLDPDVLAFGHGLGHDGGVRTEFDRAVRHAQPSDLGDVLISTLASRQTDRCFVEFSGGVDSSLVLSAATQVARAKGLSLPVPVTLRYSASSTDERHFQEAMVDHLGLDEWTIFDVDDELDLLSESAQRHLLTHGPTIAARIATRDWWLGQLERGRHDDVSIINGEGGDEVLGSAPLASVHAVRYALTHRRHGRQAIGVVRHSATRRWNAMRGRIDRPSWLTPQGVRRYRRIPRPRSLTMRRFLRNYRSTDTLVRAQSELTAQAARHGLTYFSPLLDIDFLATLVTTIPDHRFINRPLTIQAHFAEFLPPMLLQRTSKVYFGEAVFNNHTRRFAHAWDGRRGVPVDLVDPDMVRDSWLRDHDARSALMLQSAWLASQARP